MIRTATTTLAVAGALLMVACGLNTNSQMSRPVDGSRGSPSDTLRDESQTTLGDTLGADIRLKGDRSEWTIWATINAADDQGISIDNVKTGDKITIEGISGVAYFDGQSGWDTFFSVVRKVADNGAVAGGTGRIAESVIKALDVGEENEKPKVNPGTGDASKPRDGFGRNLGNGEYAENEGGVVICTPKATGPMYAHPKNRPTNKGRTKDHLKDESEMKDGDCFFAIRGGEAVEINGDGVLYIYAFDTDYRDNSGVYEIKFRITRRLGVCTAEAVEGDGTVSAYVSMLGWPASRCLGGADPGPDGGLVPYRLLRRPVVATSGP